ncbi:DUF6193 family natural product biosynthesis protein [Kitasatospora sp. NBC_00085]|uniref:DUF6193 family natural product biosynthesis protein n=1 Tax=unclassified Kitasatospora TaxID=2633591 RepID=UPI003868565B
MAEETVVQKTWRGMLEGHPMARRGEPAVIAAAYAEPRLRGPVPVSEPRGAHLPQEHAVPVEQRPAVHRGRRTIVHRVRAAGRAAACPGRVTHTA